MLGRSTATPMIRTFGLLGVLTLMLALLVPTAYGATLFSDDFEDGNASGWSASGGSWGIASDGSQVYRQSTVSGTSLSLAGSSWTDLVLEARVKPISFSGGSEYAAIIARAQSTSTYYYLSIRNANKVEIKRVVNGSQSVLQSVAFTVNTGTWYTLRFELAGSSLRGFVNGTQYVSVSDSSIAAGQVGLATFNGTASFDSVLVTGSGTGVTPTAVPPTNTPGGPTATRTPTPAGPTATRTPTPAGPTATTGPINNGLVGYGAGTTGGAGGSTTTVNTLSALQSAASASGAQIILVNGTISGSASVEITSNKTIMGVGTSGRLVGIELNIGEGTSNVIIRNLSISKVVASRDHIHIQGPNVSRIWIDHNDISSDTTHDKDYYDGGIDITHGVDNVTVSWNVIHDHYKTSLIGHSDSNSSEDTGKFHVTYHHNYFYNVSSRGPSIRFGTLHSYNNLFENFFDASTGISSRMGACSRIENNVFTGVSQPVLTTQSGTGSDAGGVQLIGNSFGGGTVETSPTCTLNPPYSYSLDSTSNLSSIVKANAGVGKVN